VFKSAAVAVLFCILIACSAQRPRPSAPQIPSAPGAVLQALPAPGTYRIDEDASELRILVYRAGSLAGIGHNHVIINRSVSGFVQIAGSLSDSSVSLQVPVDAFVVDEAEARREEGDEFPGDIPDDAKSGTRRNMLSGAVLNAAQFPIITLKSTALKGTAGKLTADLSLIIAGHEAAVSVPLTLQGDSQHLWAIGSFELRQSAIGLVPYSLLHGALQVQDLMRMKFKIAVTL
jgi:polyisoprenoid-binding protein YceI